MMNKQYMESGLQMHNSFEILVIALLRIACDTMEPKKDSMGHLETHLSSEGYPNIGQSVKFIDAHIG